MTNANSNRDRAASLLAVTLSRGQATYATPSDEELACLLADNLSEESLSAENLSVENKSDAGNRLDATRKAQIMDSIATDPECYSRWISLVESADTLGFESFVDNKAAASVKARSGGFFSFLQERWLSFSTAGGGMVAAAAVFLMLASPGYDAGVNDLYSDYGIWEEKPSKLSTTRSLEKRSDIVWDAADQSVYAGLQKGLIRLGDDFEIANLARPEVDDANTLSTKQTKALEAIGQLTAIAYFKCSLGAPPAFFEETFALMHNAKQDLSTLENETARLIRSTIQGDVEEKGDGVAEQQVCELSANLVKHFRA